MTEGTGIEGKKYVHAATLTQRPARLNWFLLRKQYGCCCGRTTTAAATTTTSVGYFPRSASLLLRSSNGSSSDNDNDNDRVCWVKQLRNLGTDNNLCSPCFPHWIDFPAVLAMVLRSTRASLCCPRPCPRRAKPRKLARFPSSAMHQPQANTTHLPTNAHCSLPRPPQHRSNSVVTERSHINQPVHSMRSCGETPATEHPAHLGRLEGGFFAAREAAGRLRRRHFGLCK